MLEIYSHGKDLFRQLSSHMMKRIQIIIADEIILHPIDFTVLRLYVPLVELFLLGLAKAESSTNILTWLENIYPDSDMRPSYIAIDKAYQVMQKAINNGSWEQWWLTTWFIVDSYHYINHKAEDVLCRTWCNPTPSDGSAPNLIGQKVDEKGNVHQF